MDKASRLLLFADVVEAGSFSRAADHRNVNRSVISKQIGQLEEELQVRLFNRSTRSVSLTGLGNAIYPHALRMREAMESVEELAQLSQHEPLGTLKISVPSNFGRHFLPKVLRQYLRQYPQMHIDLRLEDQIIDLIGGGYDLAIRISQLRDSSLIARPLARNRPVLVAAPAFIERYGMPSTLDELITRPAVIYARDGMILDRVNYITASGVVEKASLKSRYMANDPEMLLGAILDGLCFGVVPSYSASEAIRQERLVPLLPTLKLLPWADLHVVYPHRQFLAQKTRGFIDCLQSMIGGHPPLWERDIPGFADMYGFVDDQPPRLAPSHTPIGENTPL
ncbi:LysR family transcriptional regulator [Halotalea alkalilenta]|uniref:LysR family transcriptional regulator n=1 Tax=Halotalea alkalilenta TaxID=376489 RepID=UPI0006941D93|nr:LysR family transcriptional regulator [Halotalea alkalilenta]